MMRRLPALVLCAVVALCLLGCSGGEERRPGTPVTPLREYKGTQGPFPDRGFMVVRRAEIWAALWAGREAPAVNFAEEMVLVALMGRQPTGGYDITVDEVRATPTQMTAYVTERVPAPGAGAPDIITYPYHMVVVPVSSLPVRMLIAGRDVVQPVTIQNAYQGTASAIEAPTTLVVRDAQAWANLAGRVGLDPVPAIDFETYQVAAIALGTRPTGAVHVRITGVIREEERWVVQYRVIEPPADVPAPPGPTAPWAVAVLPREDVPIAFRNVQPPVPGTP